MFDAVLLAQEAASLCLEGKPTDSLADRVADLKVVDFAKSRERLRPNIEATTLD